MTKISLETRIKAPIERVFDLSRSIDAHMDSASSTGETAIAGKMSGLIGLGETVTWSAVHFGVRQRLTVEIVAFNRPHSFADQMVSGAFKSMHHRHEFEESGGETLMKDHFEFEAPFGLVGVIAEKLILFNYMRRFLEVRNARLKVLAEGNEWQQFLHKSTGYLYVEEITPPG
jgi:ligand-binding SRPBCC domain-containing protein